MRLHGSYLSPYTRRVAVSLNVLGIPFELDEVYTSKEPEKVRSFSPLTRVPALTLDDGDILVESAAILDEIDQMVGPERALIPAGGALRRRVMQATAIGVGCMEKTQWALYETRYHPPEKVHDAWIARNEAQVLGGLAHLEGVAAANGTSDRLLDTPSLTQADITVAVAFTFVALVRPALGVGERFPGLAAHAARCEAQETFLRVAPPQ